MSIGLRRPQDWFVPPPGIGQQGLPRQGDGRRVRGDIVESKGVQVVLEQEAAKNPQAKEFTAERFYDNSLVQELINEGFYKSLWGK